MFPNATMEANRTKPRKNAFNLRLDDVTVWDGHALGPPRALKFDILIGLRLHEEVLKASSSMASSLNASYPSGEILQDSSP